MKITAYEVIENKFLKNSIKEYFGFEGDDIEVTEDNRFLKIKVHKDCIREDVNDISITEAQCEKIPFYLKDDSRKLRRKLGKFHLYNYHKANNYFIFYFEQEQK